MVNGPPEDDPRFLDYEPTSPDNDVVSIDRERARRNMPSGPASGWEASLVYEQRGRGNAREVVIAATAGNLALHLINEPAWAGCLGYDQFSEREVWLREPPPLPGMATPKLGEVCDEHDTYVQHWFHAKRGFNVSAVTQAVMSAARSNCFHPVRDYLTALDWDGTHRLRTLLPHYFSTVDNLYTQEVGRRWMISAVARVMRPGCKVDTMLIIEGEQGKRKSTALAALVGQNWFADTKLDLAKVDAYQALRGKWVIEMAELDAMKNQELTRIKAFLTSSKDSYRPSYGKRVRDYERQTVFAGTTNEDKYLQDLTGNRRFWPVAAGDIRIDELARDRDQLWAEAFQAFQGGANWWLDTEELILLAEGQQEERMVDEHPWMPLIRDWLRRCASGNPLVRPVGSEDIDLAKGVTTTQVLLGALGARKDAIGKGEAMKVGTILRQLKFESRQVRTGAAREWRYFPPIRQNSSQPAHQNDRPVGQVVTPEQLEFR
jgi:putative DNA primase/helicase